MNAASDIGDEYVLSSRDIEKLSEVAQDYGSNIFNEKYDMTTFSKIF